MGKSHIWERAKYNFKQISMDSNAPFFSNKKNIFVGYLNNIVWKCNHRFNKYTEGVSYSSNLLYNYILNISDRILDLFQLHIYIMSIVSC